MPAQPELPTAAHDPRDDSVGALVGRLVEDGKAYAKAELNVVRQVARRRAGKAKKGAVLAVAGITLLMCAMTALVITLIVGIGRLLGDRFFWSGLIVVVLLSLVGGLLAMSGVKGLGALAGDEEEKKALASTEVTP